MVAVKTNEFGDKYIDATITLKIKAYVRGGTEVAEVSEEMAQQIVYGELDRLASSNDGSELLANVSDDQINFV